MTPKTLKIYVVEAISGIFMYRPVALSLTFGRQSGYHTITGRLQIPTRGARQTFWAAH